MAKSTPIERWKRTARLRLHNLFFLAAAFVGPFSGVLLDQTVAYVGKQIILLRDVEVEYAFNTLLQHKSLPSRTQVREKPDSFEQARDLLVQKALIRNYLDTTGLVASLPQDRSAQMKKDMIAQFSSEQTAQAEFEKEHYRDMDIDQYIQNRVRYEYFLEQTIGSRMNVTEHDVRAYYEKEKDNRYLGKSFESVQNLVKAQVTLNKLKQEFEKWLETESKRTEIALLPLLFPEKK